MRFVLEVIELAIANIPVFGLLYSGFRHSKSSDTLQSALSHTSAGKGGHWLSALTATDCVALTVSIIDAIAEEKQRTWTKSKDMKGGRATTHERDVEQSSMIRRMSRKQ